MYLLPDVNFRLRPRILLEPKPGTRVVADRFGVSEELVEKRLKLGRPSRVILAIVAQL